MAKKTSDTATFVPMVSFYGYPDGVNEVLYEAGKTCEASPEYVSLLTAKGLVADSAPSAPATEDVAA